MNRVILACLLSVLVSLATGETGVMCTQDALQCEDGSAVGRDPENNCEFKPCPGNDEVSSKRQLRENTFNNARNRLENLRQRMHSRLSSEDDVMCTADVKQCPDGTHVSRTPPSCDFKVCPDGTKLSRTQYDDVQTFPFPSRE